MDVIVGYRDASSSRDISIAMLTLIILGLYTLLLLSIWPELCSNVLFLFSYTAVRRQLYYKYVDTFPEVEEIF